MLSVKLQRRPTIQEEMHLYTNHYHYLTLWFKVTRNFDQYTLHHVIYAPKRIRVNTSNCLGGDIYRQSYMKHCSVFSTLCKLCTYKIEYATVLPAKSDSEVMFCLQTYQGLII